MPEYLSTIYKDFNEKVVDSTTNIIPNLQSTKSPPHPWTGGDWFSKHCSVTGPICRVGGRSRLAPEEKNVQSERPHTGTVGLTPIVAASCIHIAWWPCQHVLVVGKAWGTISRKTVAHRAPATHSETGRTWGTRWRRIHPLWAGWGSSGDSFTKMSHWQA